VEERQSEDQGGKLDTSKHSKEETQLTRIRDINERTATKGVRLGAQGG
jgi:hypothetical protein